ncbi:MAG: chromate transporter [Candidatus Bipolaricaulaceae bacterium]
MLPIRLFTVFFLIGLFTLGGGYVMIPLISRELVRKRGWLTDEEFQEAVTLGSSIPGPVGPNLAFLCGSKVAGMAGALAAYLGCVLPSFLVILGIALGLSPFFSTHLAQKFFQGAGAAVTGLVAASALRLGTQISRDIFDLFLIVSASALILALKIHPLWALVWTMSFGLIWKRWHHAS